MSLTVKAYLLNEPEPKEIRRFAVEQDVCTNHDYLRQKITHIFPVLKDKTFSLFWKDAENELIAFSSDEEQTEALGFVTDGVFKIYIKEKVEDGNNPEPQQDNVFHPHVFCDGCDGPVYGIRYKCTVCLDYDLCSKCKAKGLHSEHSMMAIPHPRCGGWMGYGVFTPPPPPPFHGHHHGRPHHGFRPHGPPRFPGPHGKRPFGPGGFGKCWRAGVNMCHQTMKNFWQATNQTQTDNGKEMPAGDAQKESQENAASSNKENGFQSANEEYLKTVGEHVAAMLDPLGINVDVDIEHGGVRQKCCGKGPHGVWASWEGCSCCEGCTECSSTQTNAGQKQDGKDDVEENDVNMECGDTEATNKAAQDTETGEAGTAVGADKGDSSPERDWTIVDDCRNENVNGKPHDPDVVNTETNETAPSADAEDKITQALDHMKGMGFSDEGGWLTTLLKATRGDINKALDAIRANCNTTVD